jgi:Phage tail repeat like
VAYPNTLDSLNDPTASTPLNDTGPGLAHSLQHTNANTAIEAIQSTLGTLPAGGYGSVRLRLEALDANLAAGSHDHAISRVTGLQAALDAKAAASHTHTIANVTSLQTTLDGKATLNSATVPSDLGVAAIGSVLTAARADHVHKIPTLANLGAAATTTTVSAGSGLTGGGDLSANRTLAANFVASGGDGGVATTVARGDHLHDGRYFTETEADARFAAIGHNHNATYARVVALATGAALPNVASYSEGDLVVFY